MAPLLLCALLGAPGPTVEESELKAQQALAKGLVAQALDAYEEAIRAAEETATKARLRDAYRKAGWAEPRLMTLEEGQIAARHIREERIRVLDLGASRMEEASQLHGAILVRRSILDLVAPDEQREREQRDRIAAIVQKLVYRPTDEEKAQATRIEKSAKDPNALLEQARALLAKKQHVLVARLCQAIEFGEGTQETKEGARKLRSENEAAAVAEVPPAERDAARAIVNDERFDRIDIVPTRHFLLLGPRAFVQAIPEAQKTLLDLAYIFQSDLAQQILDFDGVRVVIYYQETFDFGGGLAGGKLIRIGNRAIRPPIAGMLHYHELGHCIFGRGWLHEGFTEGLADFAAGFTLDALGETAEAERFITAAKEAFVRFYLGRDVAYHQIQSYQPSAGFLFSLLPPREAPYDWAPIRRIFHRMREAQFGDWPEREHQLMRYFGCLVAEEYGVEAFDRLREWGWPVARTDLEAVRRESAEFLAAAKQGEFQLLKDNPEGARELFAGVEAARLPSHLAPRARMGLLEVALRRGDAEKVEELARGLGLVRDMKILGVFHAKGRGAHVLFPPECGVVRHEGEVRVGIETGIWKRAKIEPNGYLDLKKQGYGYPENAVAFALTYVRCAEPTLARIWLGSDDGHTLYVNGRLREKRDGSRACRFDDDFADVPLEKGWNRILVKVHNTGGEWGLILRVTRPNDDPIPDAEFSADDHEAELPAPGPPSLRAGPSLHEEWKALASARWMTAVGKFDTQNGKLRPLATEKFGLWQRFLVDPDKPKDGPANILWLRSPALPSADSFELELAVAGRGRFGVTIDGEGENDAQSGHTFVLDRAEKELTCHWYRYDRLFALQPGVPAPEGDLLKLTIRREGTKWHVAVDGVALFENADAPRLPAFGIGLMTWGRDPLFESFRLTPLLDRP